MHAKLEFGFILLLGLILQCCCFCLSMGFASGAIPKGDSRGQLMSGIVQKNGGDPARWFAKWDDQDDERNDIEIEPHQADEQDDKSDADQHDDNDDQDEGEKKDAKTGANYNDDGDDDDDEESEESNEIHDTLTNRKPLKFLGAKLISDTFRLNFLPSISSKNDDEEVEFESPLQNRLAKLRRHSYFTSTCEPQHEHFRCLYIDQCLPLNERCNGKVQCADGSDELKCPKRNVKKPLDEEKAYRNPFKSLESHFDGSFQVIDAPKFSRPHATTTTTTATTTMTRPLKRPKESHISLEGHLKHNSIGYQQQPERIHYAHIIHSSAPSLIERLHPKNHHPASIKIGLEVS